MMAHTQRSYADLMAELRQLCLAGMSGIWTLATHDNRAARIGIDRGRIVVVHFQQLRGQAALVRLRAVERGRSGFTPGAPPPGGAGEPLPPTEAILRFLARQGAAADASARSDIPAARLREAVLAEATASLGPMGPTICEEHFERCGALNTQAGVQRLLSAVAAELGDLGKEEAFKRRVLARLGGTAGEHG